MSGLASQRSVERVTAWGRRKRHRCGEGMITFAREVLMRLSSRVSH